MKVVSMRRKGEDAGGSVSAMIGRPGVYQASPDSEFPHHLHFDDTDLERLGIHEARAGDEYEVHGRVKVHQSEEREGRGGSEKRVHLHVTHLGAERKGGPSVREDVDRAAKEKGV